MSPGSWILGNAAAATVLAAVVWLLQRRVRHAALLHAAWAVVLLRLVAFPPFEWRVLPAELFPAGAAPVPASFRDLPAGPVLVSPPDADRAPSLPALALLVALAGTVALPVVAWRRARAFRRLLRSAPLAPAALQARADTLARGMGLRRAPAIRLAPVRMSPAVTPAPRVEIVVPARLAASLPAGQLDALLAHELAHVRRRDPWLRPLELGIVALWWWHPVAWWARRNLREAEERACDDLVVRHLPSGARDYADALVGSAAFLSNPRVPTPALATGFGIRNLEERLTMILDRRSSRPLSRPWLVLGGIALLLTLLVVPSTERTASAAVRGEVESRAPFVRPEPPAPAAPLDAAAPAAPLESAAPAAPSEAAAPAAPVEPAAPARVAPRMPEPGESAPADPLREERLSLLRELRELEVRQADLRVRLQELDGTADPARMPAAAPLGIDGDRARVEDEARRVALRAEAEMRLQEAALGYEAMREAAAPERLAAMREALREAQVALRKVDFDAQRDELRRLSDELARRAAEEAERLGQE